MLSNSRSVFLAILLAVSCCSFALAQRSWDGGNATFVWGDNGNWNPDGSPNGVAISIGNLVAATNDTTLLDAAYSIDSLTITNGADVENSTDNGATNDFQLTVNGLTTVSDAGSSIVIFGGDPEGLDTNNLTINSGASVILNSSTAQSTAVVEVDGDTGTGVLAVNAGGTLSGNGRIELEASPVAATSLLANDGLIIASASALIILTPPVGTLQITATSANARFDWDGGGAGILQANGNQTLDIDVAPGTGAAADAFSGVMNLSTGSTIDISTAWALDTGTINANTAAFGFILPGQDPNPGPAAHIAGAAWTMTGGTINIDDTWDSLQIDSTATASGGVINNDGTMIFNAAATFLSGVDFNMSSNRSSLVVNSTVNIDTPDFAMDGAGGLGSTTINAGGILDLDLGVGADLSMDHTINLNGGELDVTTSAATIWSLGGTVNAAGGVTSTINSSGETFVINGEVNVTANSTLTINSTSVFSGIAAVVIDAGSTLNMGSVTYSGGSYTGGGVFRKGTATIAAATTWNVGTVDLDDGNTTLNANLTINASSLEIDADGVDATHTINDGTLLTVNVGAGWRLDPTGTIAYNGNASAETYLAGSDVLINGTLNHTGDGRINARIDVGATGVVNVLTAGEPLRLNGGNDTTSPNTIAGGTIQGVGILAADGGRALHGFGTISATVDFPSANLKANNGTLNVSGAITSVRIFGTADVDGILNVTNAWNTTATVSVSLEGGELRGATITNGGASGINGHGLVSARVLNDTRIDAEGGGMLIVETAANNNDWDGAGNAGALNALSGNLEIRDDAAVLFNGSVQVNSSFQVFANGFELEFEPASTLTLNGGSFRSTNATDLGGTVTVGPGLSDLGIAGTTIFEATSSTTIAGMLRLNNPATQINSGATFAGGGILLNSTGFTLRLQDGADVDVLVQNQGTLVIGNTAAQATGLDFQQDASGLWNVDLSGLGLAQFDRYTLTGTASLAGTLDIDLGGGYVPNVGDTLTILSAVGGVTGSFDALTQPAGMPAGLFFGLAYQATFAQLVVIDHLPGDYNKNGVVDAADYTLWRDTLGQVITALSGADGNGNGMVDASDYTFWKANFGQTAAGSGTGSTTGVPEPTTLVLLMILAATGWRVRRGRAT